MPNSLRLRYLLPGSFLGVLVLLLISLTEAQATHIRAGDITAKRDTTPNPNPRRFFFTMIMYTDRASTADDPTVQISTGAGTVITVPRQSVTPIGEPSDLVDKEVFKWEYTYPADGSYIVSWNGINRNPNILNMAPPSDQLTFFISTTININALRGFNSTPILTVAPVDLAAIGRKWVHNPGAFDPDGDSLAFKLRVPQRIDGSGSIAPVPGYSLPDRTFNCRNSVDTGPAFLTLDLTQGQLTWDAPCVKGEYNVAFVVEEWRVTPGRGAVKLGEVVRDMQIIVKETPNRPPVLAPKDTCVIAGTTMTGIVRATDPDNDFIRLTVAGAGGVVPPATFTPLLNQAGLATGRFTWSTQCTDVRERAYQVIFRAEDVRPPTETKLADLQPWNIRVVGPPPQNLIATGQDRAVNLTWDKYSCQNASTIRIYRREGPSNFKPDVCQTGVPASTGYVLIGEVPKDQTSFLDNNGGAGLKAGVDYCYIIYAEFPAPAGGKSIASVEACISIEQDIPYLTNVTVDATSATTGQITVKWTQPRRGLNNLTPPFEYRLYRRTGQSGNDGYVEVKRTRNLADTTFVNANLNTLEQAYRYKLEFYQSGPNGAATVLRDSTSASSVRLEATPTSTSADKFVTLNWSYNVPWKNEVLLHRIYRVVNGNRVLIDSVQATAANGTYVDRGTVEGAPLVRGNTYCYVIETRGTYQIAGLPEPLINFSQQACVELPQVVCPPTLTLAMLNCDEFNQNPTLPPYQNVLSWVPQVSDDCTADIDYYTVYYKPSLDAEYVRLDTTSNTTYTHTGLQSFAGCYKVTATDMAGNESDFSNEECNDNCITFMLPNIITPNGDGLNDVFRPDKRTAFIRSMKFTVYNRWGVKVYESNATTGDDLYINWGGVDNDGNRLSDGVYYYEAEVEFYTIDPAKAKSKYKGWVEIAR